jgi:hypothetical protein
MFFSFYPIDFPRTTLLIKPIFRDPFLLNNDLKAVFCAACWQRPCSAFTRAVIKPDFSRIVIYHNLIRERTGFFSHNIGRFCSIGSYPKNIDNLSSIHFDAIYSVPSFRHAFSRNPGFWELIMIDSGLSRRSLSVGGLKACRNDIG